MINFQEVIAKHSHCTFKELIYLPLFDLQAEIFRHLRDQAAAGDLQKTKEAAASKPGRRAIVSISMSKMQMEANSASLHLFVVSNVCLGQKFFFLLNNIIRLVSERKRRRWDQQASGDDTPAKKKSSSWDQAEVGGQKDHLN